MEHKYQGYYQHNALNSTCSLWLLQKLNKSSHSLILAIMPIRSQLLLAIAPPLSLGSGLNIVLMLLSPMVAVQPNSLTLIFAMPVASLALERLTTPHKSPNCSRTSPIRASLLRLSA